MANKKKKRPTTDTRNIAQRFGGMTIAPYMLKLLGYDKAADVVGFPNYLEKEEKIHERGMRKEREDMQGRKKGGAVRAMKNGGAVMKGRGPKFKGQS